MEVTEVGTVTPPRSRAVRALPLVALALLAVAFFAFDLDALVSFEALREHHERLSTYVAAHPGRSVAIFIAVHSIGVATMLLPGSVAMLTGGFLFGPVRGTLWLSVGTTLGGSLLFLLARTTLRGWLERRAGAGIERLRAGFERNAFTYMLFLRVVGMTPLAFQNLAPAFFGVRLGPYAVAAFLGCMPWTFVFASVGGGLSSVLASGEDPDLSVILAPQTLLPIFALGMAVLTPVMLRYRRERRAAVAAERDA